MIKMRKKLLEYIIKETKNKDLISTTIELTLEECDFLYDHKISIIKTRVKYTFEPTNYTELIDIFTFHREN